MNDRYDSADGYELVGYDDYGQPVYRQVPRQSAQQTYDSYGQQQGGYEAQGYGYDPYGAGGQSPAAPQQPPAPPSYDPWSGGTGPSGPPAGQPPAGPSYGQQYGQRGQQQGQQQGQQYGQQYDPYGPAATSAPQPRVGAPAQGGAPYIPQQAGVPQQAGPDEVPDASGGYDEPDRAPDYRTEQFSFVEEPDGDSEDVIDWMKFTENRTERREEAKRRARSRKTALGVVFLLVVVSGVGYLWFAGKLPGTGDSGSAGSGVTAGAQKRDVIALHLHNTKEGGTLTALLVDNTTTKQGTTVLLPNSLSLSDDDGETTTLAKSVDDDGRDGTRDALDTVLGTRIEGTWRLDTPYLENLVDIVGTVEVDTDTNVPDGKKKGAAPLVRKGKEQSLSGKMAVAYATYRAKGEPETAELQRFGAVMRGVLRKMSSDPQAATITVQTLAQIIEPPLTDKDLGAFLAGMADHAKGGDYETALLPVQGDGTLSAQESDTVVKKILGGTAKSPDKGSAVQVAVQNASGDKKKADSARVTLLNGGFGYQASSPAQSAQATSEVRYADAAQKDDATEVAKTLGLPTSAVKKGEVAANADVTVVLGQDYTSSS